MVYKKVFRRITILCCLILKIENSKQLPLGLSKPTTQQMKYHSHEEFTDYLKSLSIQYPSFTNLYSIGKSVLNKDLWVLKISAAPNTKIGVPNVRLIGNIHGNEPLGKEIILTLAQHILSQYGSNKRFQWLMNSTRIHLLPSANPDGFEKASVHCEELSGSRNNIRDVDINTNFPNMFESNLIPRQEETQALMKWFQDIPFVLSGSLHTSALVVTYPYDSKPQTTWDAAFKLLSKSDKTLNMKDIWQEVKNVAEGPSPTPDDDTFKHLASIYASSHPHMYKDVQCPRIQKKFENGTINGGEWLSKKGTMQDYNYFYHGCMELSLVISCCRYPGPKDLPIYWNENREPLIQFLSQVHLGVQGLILNITNETIPNVQLMVLGRNITFNSSKSGEYWRILLPGKYKIQASAVGYQTTIVDFEVKRSTYLNMTWLNITMTKCPIDAQHGVCEQVHPVEENTEKENQSLGNITKIIDDQITLPTLFEAKNNPLDDIFTNSMVAATGCSLCSSFNWSLISFVTKLILHHLFSFQWMESL